MLRKQAVGLKIPYLWSVLRLFIVNSFLVRFAIPLGSRFSQLLLINRRLSCPVPMVWVQSASILAKIYYYQQSAARLRNMSNE